MRRFFATEGCRNAAGAASRRGTGIADSFTYHDRIPYTMCSSYELRSKQFGAIPLYAVVASSGCAHALL